MPQESSDRLPLFSTAYSGPAEKSDRQSASEKCQQVVKPNPGLSFHGYLQYRLVQGSQKLSIAFHLIPGYINKFKKRVLLLETFVSCGAAESTCLNWKNGCFDRNHLVCGTARPRA